MDPQIGLENLVLARDALTALNVRYFLMDGTLLGLARNGAFIEWDGDIDIGVIAEDFTFLSFLKYTAIMRSKGFTSQTHGVWGKFFYAHWWRRDVQIDTWFYFRSGDRRYARAFAWGTPDLVEFSYPAWLLETLTKVEFYGISFMVPRDKEAVLSHEYGDWRVPKTDWDWRYSPLNITHRIKVTKSEAFLARLSNKVLRLSDCITRRMWRDCNITPAK